MHSAVRDPAALGGFKFLKIDVPDSLATARVPPNELAEGWMTRLDVSRAIGDRWLRAAATPILIVPSVLVPETLNVLIDPRHADARRITLLASIEYPLDARLVS